MTHSNRPVFRLIVVLFFIGTLCGSSPQSINGDEEKDPKNKEVPTSVWMKKKLDYSQNILSGLASADFDKIAANADAMQVLSKIEGFIRSRTPGYRTQLQIFEQANQEIIVQAKKDNVEGATLAFTQLTISCVNCHKQLRESMRK